MKALLVFGDDWQGNCFAFDPAKKFEMVEIDPWGETRRIGRDFAEFVQNRWFDGE